MAFDKAALLAQVKATGVDMTQAQAFTEQEPYPEGTHRARFVGYIELGKQEATYQGKPKTEDQVVVLMELSGPKIKAREDGGANLIKIGPMNKSLSDKAAFFKLFGRLNYAGKATHIAELLGDAYLVGIYHRKYKGRDGKDRTAVELRKKGEPYDVRPPRREDLDTGEWHPVAVDAAKSPEKLFLWDYADKDQWASIFIDGEYPERKDEKTGEVTAPAKSKNAFQNSIKLAKNFQGSPIHILLAANGAVIDIPDAESGVEREEGADDAAPAAANKPAEVPTGAAADDALAGVV